MRADTVPNRLAAGFVLAALALSGCSGQDSTDAATTTTTAQTTTAAKTTTPAKSTTQPASSATRTSATGASVTNGTAAAGPTETWATNPLYVGNIPEEQFVKGEPTSEDIKINGKSYQFSWVWDTYLTDPQNETAEFNIPLGYKSLDFTLGMTDETSIDKYADGIASLTVYVGGNAVYGPAEFKYTDEIPVSIPIDGKSRIRVDISGLQNNEFAALAGAKFVR